MIKHIEIYFVAPRDMSVGEIAEREPSFDIDQAVEDARDRGMVVYRAQAQFHVTGRDGIEPAPLEFQPLFVDALPMLTRKDA